MGAACATAFAQAGYRVAVSSSSGKGERLGRQLGGLGFTVSNTDTEAMTDMVAEVVSHYGRLDIVVNSCGSAPRGDLVELQDADWQRGLDMILMSVIRLARLATPHLRAAGGGAIVNISSFVAVEPDLGYPVSSVMRGALASYAKLYATRFGPDNIRMNNILPGYIATFPVDEETRLQIPLGRYGSVDEIAGTALHLASDAGSYISGQNIRVDGGVSRST